MSETETVAAARKREFNDCLAAYCRNRFGEDDPLRPVLRYVLDAEGKRVRPILAMLSAEAAGSVSRRAWSAGIAVELIHTYSLIHDDLPCMDNDDYRRGRLTAHKAFDEPMALLAGDALLTEAFAVLSGPPGPLATDAPDDGARVRQIRELATAAGPDGMALGQALDLYWTAKTEAGQDDLDRIHRLKTGRLMGAACAMGALAAGADEPVVAALRRFGEFTGLSFQIVDDLLDDGAETGKTAGKDREMGKLTYLATMSREEAAREAQSWQTRALESLTAASLPHGMLRDFVSGLLERKH